MVTIDQERPYDSGAIETLLDQAFGPNRTEKSSYSLRGPDNLMTDLCLVARMGDVPVATVRFWNVDIADMMTGEREATLFLGPFAVCPSAQGQGVGSMLMKRAMHMLDVCGYNRVLLVGDPAYYERFGFRRALPRYISLPGGRDASRLLVRERRDMLAGLPLVGRLAIPTPAPAPVPAPASAPEPEVVFAA